MKQKPTKNKTKKIKAVNQPADTDIAELSLIKKYAAMCHKQQIRFRVTCKILLTHTITYFCGGGSLPKHLVKSIGECAMIHDSPDIIISIIILLEIGFKFDGVFSMYLINNYPNMIDSVMITHNNKIDLEFLEDISNDANWNVIDPLIKTGKIEISMSCAEREIYVENPDSIPYIILTLMDDPNFIVTNNFVDTVTKNHNFDIFEKMLVNGGVLNSSVLETACTGFPGNPDTYKKIKFILDNNIKPTQCAFRNVINTATYIRSFRRIDKDSETMLIFNLLIDHGYEVTYDDIIIALGKNIIIENINRSKIKFDSTYLNICSDIGVHNPYEVIDLVPDITYLVHACKKHNNLKNIKEIITRYNIIPDASCMREACQYSDNLKTLEYLISKGGHIDFECLNTYIQACSDGTGQLAYVFNEFKKTAHCITNKNIC